MTTRFRYAIADVFTSRALEGNQLAVFTDATRIPEARLQDIAREMNFSETVFVFPPTDRTQAHVRIRIFTPGGEVPFAGHPVLGTAFVLGIPLQAVDVLLETGRGIVPVALQREGAQPVFGWMKQPVPTWKPFGAAETQALLAGLGVERSELPVEVYSNGIDHVYVALPSEDEVAAVEPDLAALKRLGFYGINCFAGEGLRWKTRMFAPAKGVAEDPATGSAAGPLAVHLARHGRIAWGDEIVIRQGAELRRPSELTARAEGSAGGVEAVSVGGAAVIVARGELLL